MNGIEQLLTGTGTAGVFAAVWAFFRSETGRRLVNRLRKTITSEAVALREAIENLSRVVEAQGESIEWLRGELDRTRAELEEARSALIEREGKLERENDKLRKRVAELEAQVKALEEALAKRSRRKKTEAK
jgi:cell division protein FtsB